MSLASFAFVGVVAAVALAMRLVPHSGVQKLLLVGASLAFYTTWGRKPAVLLVALALAAWAAGMLVSRAQTPLARKGVVGVFVAIALGVLGAFKYAGFFASTLVGLGVLGSASSPLLRLAVPAGISFVTFQTIGYVVDVYRERDKARSVLDVALLVSFFPHLIAGPLLKSRDFLGLFDEPLRPTWRGAEEGAARFLVGAVKKVVIADQLGVFVDAVYAHPDWWSSATVWLAGLAYALRILCDFSGYSDMAIGSARAMGVTLPENFDWPYLSGDVTTFWRRWHITLSSWLREYLYFPLGGNRRGQLRQAFNLVVVMTLGGLWHGASWNFVLWGLAHGLALVLHKYYRAWRDATLPESLTSSLPYRAGAWALTFAFVLLAWVPFATADFPAAADVFARMFGAGAVGQTMSWLPPSLVSTSVVFGVALLARVRGYEWRPPALLSFRGALAVTLAIAALFFLAPVASTPFVYAGF